MEDQVIFHSSAAGNQIVRLVNFPAIRSHKLVFPSYAVRSFTKEKMYLGTRCSFKEQGIKDKQKKENIRVGMRTTF